MPAGKVTKKDKPSEQYRLPEKLEILARHAEERFPYGIGGKEEPSITEPLLDIIPQPPAGKIAKLAISLPYATKQILKIPRGGLSPSQLKDVYNTLKILTATPKRALQSVSDIVVQSPETFQRAADILGNWMFSREIRLMPIVKSEQLPERIQRFLARATEKGTIYKLPEATAHEVGHEITERLLQKRGKSLEQLYEMEKPLWEGIAEYFGKQLSKKAGVPYQPKFSYGAGQELIFDVLERAPSKNPYMNVYRFLQRSGELPKSVPPKRFGIGGTGTEPLKVIKGRPRPFRTPGSPTTGELKQWKKEMVEQGFSKKNVDRAVKESLKKGVNPTASDDLYSLGDYLNSLD